MGLSASGDRDGGVDISDSDRVIGHSPAGLNDGIGNFGLQVLVSAVIDAVLVVAYFR